MGNEKEYFSFSSEAIGAGTSGELKDKWMWGRGEGVNAEWVRTAGRNRARASGELRSERANFLSGR
jgi:hypothetical protein